MAMIKAGHEIMEQGAHDALVGFGGGSPMDAAKLCNSLKVPSLADFGLNREDYLSKIPVMTQQALASGSPANNPRVPTEQEVIELYKAAWS